MGPCCSGGGWGLWDETYAGGVGSYRRKISLENKRNGVRPMGGLVKTA